jgi:8-oxo-dGTP pyrophosphatase MutT (NUDIX family)
MAEKKRKDATRIERVFSAGGAVYKKTNSKIVWLITRSNPNSLYPQDVWRLPKGWLDDLDNGKRPGPLASGKQKAAQEAIERAAKREVAEEGGVEAKIVDKLETEKLFYTNSEKKTLKFITYFLLRWVRDLPEGPGEETSEIKWLPFEKARKLLSYSGEKKILDKAKNKLRKKGLI